MAEVIKIAEARGEKRANAIFFHGLGGDARTTWQADKEDEGSFWPAWLAQDIEGLSIYCIGYEAPISDRDGATMHPTDLASNVLNGLLVYPRLNEGELILIGHSLGGLIIKLMLRKAQAESYRRAEAVSFIDRV
jgi:pimeloyl-ACP methyl ester carboxylesterase